MEEERDMKTWKGKINGNLNKMQCNGMGKLMCEYKNPVTVN